MKLAPSVLPSIHPSRTPLNAVSTKKSTREHILKTPPPPHRPYPLDALLRPASIKGARLGFQIRTLASSPAEAKTQGSRGCQAMLLTQPECASRASTRWPFERQIYILESTEITSVNFHHHLEEGIGTHPRSH